ncbi:helix-turn-helix domain-containing protein, partial [Chloroflexota bacterium]
MDNKYDPNDDKLLTVSDVTAEINYSDRYIRHFLTKGIIKGSKLTERGAWRIKRNDLEDFKRRHGLAEATVQEQPSIKEQDETGITLEQTSRARSHDERIFNESDKLLSEKQLLDFLDCLEIAHEFLGSQTSRAVDFLEFFDYEGNKYLSPQLHSSCHCLQEALREVWVFILEPQHFISYKMIRKPDGTPDVVYLVETKEYFSRVAGDNQEIETRQRQLIEQLQGLVSTC